MPNNISSEIFSILTAVLRPTGGNFVFSLDTELLGVMPEFDSMSVVAVLTALEEYYGFHILDDEIDGAIFHTVGTLISFVECKLSV